nr:hypothetical protein [Tanacetum cinerariifolium]
GRYNDDEQTESDNDGNDFVHPKLSTFDEKERHEEKHDKEEEGDNVEEEKQDNDKTNEEEEEVDELYSNVNINLEGRDTKMTDASLANSSSVSSSFISNMLNLHSDAGIDSILNLNIDSTPLVDVPVTTNDEIPPSSVTTLHPPPIPLIHPLQQTPVFTPTIAPIQVNEQVSKILPRIEKFIYEQLKAEVLTRLSNKANTSHAIAANLSELKLKKILIDKIESNKSIHHIVTFKRHRDDKDDDEEPFVGSDRESKRRRAGKEPVSSSPPKETTSKSTGKSKEGSKSHQKSTGNNMAQKEDTHDSFNEPMDTPLDISAFVMNRLKVDTLTLKLLVGPTFELMKGSCTSLVELEYFLEEGGASRRTYATSVTKMKATDYGHIKWIEDLVPNTMWSPVPVIYDKRALWRISYWGRKHQQFYRFAVNRESARNVYSRHIIFAVIKLQIVEWHNYKHLDWITICRDNDKFYTFKKGNYKRLHLQDIEDMLLLLV